MGIVLGPYDVEDWYTMGQLKLDLLFTRKNLKHKPDYVLAEKFIAKKLKNYMTRIVSTDCGLAA